MCLMCDENVCENETHFIFSCYFYHDVRTKLYDSVLQLCPEFSELTEN